MESSRERKEVRVLKKGFDRVPADVKTLIFLLDEGYTGDMTAFEGFAKKLSEATGRNCIVLGSEYSRIIGL